MLILSAVAMIATYMTLIMSGRVSPMVALTLVPLVFGMLAGFGAELGPMMLNGVRQLTPTAVMLVFAIFYFSLMVDAGLFDPLVNFVVRRVDGDPVHIVTGTAVLALLVSLDGNGAATYLICTSAMLPLYRRMQLNPSVLACVLMLSVGATHIIPWGGPTAKVAAALNVDPLEVFLPLIPAVLISALGVVGVAYRLGRAEQRRLAARDCVEIESAATSALETVSAAGEASLKRPKLFIFNLALTLALLVGLVFQALPLPIIFMVASAIALPLNFPSLESQKARMTAHAPAAFKTVAVVMAAGALIGVLNGTGMNAAVASAIIPAIPPAAGPYFAPLTGLMSIPLTFFMDNEPFFFGMLPILTESANHYGLTAVEMARAAVTGQTVHMLIPTAASTHLLVNLVGIDFGRHQRFTVKWAVLISLLQLVVALATGAIPFRVGG